MWCTQKTWIPVIVLPWAGWHWAVCFTFLGLIWKMKSGEMASKVPFYLFSRFGDPIKPLSCRGTWAWTIRKQYQRLGRGCKPTQTGVTVGEHLSITLVDGRQGIIILFQNNSGRSYPESLSKGVNLLIITIQRCWPMGLFSSVAFTGYSVCSS